jgi:hypothetical protein
LIFLFSLHGCLLESTATVDFIAGCLALLLTTLGCYGQQTSDLNISLTAIGLLWKIADFIGKQGSALNQRARTEAPDEAEYQISQNEQIDQKIIYI